MEKKPFGVVRLFSYSINALIVLMLSVYFFDFVIKYFYLLRYFSPILINYYLAMLPIDIFAFCFDVLIIYFLFSAKKVISARTLGGAGKLSAAVLSAFFLYLLKFIFLNVFVYIKFIPMATQGYFPLLYKAFVLRLMIFFVFYLIFSMSLEYSKSIKWYFGHNYKGFYQLKDSFHLAFVNYLTIVGKIFLVVLAVFLFLFLPTQFLLVKLVLSLLIGIGSSYLLFFRSKK